MQKKGKINILAVSFESLNKKEQLERLKKRLKYGKVTKIFTPNPQMLLTALKDKRARAALMSADINLPDGIGIRVASQILGKPLPERICGIDFAEDLLRLAAEEGYSVFLLGGRSGRARKAQRELSKKYPELRICGCHNGYFERDGEDNLKVLKKINASKADILFVCLGSPIQEEWIFDNLPYLPTVKIAMGLGGSIDVWAGCICRAPLCLREHGMEWLWRAVCEPKRLHIFFDIPEFLMCIKAQKRALRKKAKRSVSVEN